MSSNRSGSTAISHSPEHSQRSVAKYGQAASSDLDAPSVERRSEDIFPLARLSKFITWSAFSTCIPAAFRLHQGVRSHKHGMLSRNTPALRRQSDLARWNEPYQEARKTCRRFAPCVLRKGLPECAKLVPRGIFPRSLQASTQAAIALQA